VSVPYAFLHVFARGPYSGNPCGVALLESWPDDATLFALTQELRAPTAAFVVAEEGGYALRWFEPPGPEVQLCGHGTLAAAKALLDGWAPGDALRFKTRFSGELSVVRSGDGFAVALPRLPAEAVPDRALVERIVGGPVEEALMAVKTLAVLPEAEAVRRAVPCMEAIGDLPADGLLVTAPGDEEGIDFVCRFFAPHRGVAEDTATGSAYCTLAPYWAARLGKREFRARQLSPRGGEVFCADEGEAVRVGGRVETLVEGKLHV
jgi:predicted PhzF superfamily epimerase YddE/YHI9